MNRVLVSLTDDDFERLCQLASSYGLSNSITLRFLVHQSLSSYFETDDYLEVDDYEETDCD